MQNSESRSRLIRNIFSNYVRFAVTGAIGFLVTPVLFHALSADRYSVLIFAVGAVTILEGLDLGMFAGLVRFVGELTARGELTELRRIASSAYFFILAVSTAASAALWFLSPRITAYFHVSSAGNSAAMVLGVIGLSLIAYVPGTVVRGVLEGNQEFVAANAVDLLTQIGRALAILILLWTGAGILAVAAVYPVAALFRHCGMTVASRRGGLRFLPSFGDANFKSLRGLSGFASLSYLCDNANWFFSQLDTFLVPRLLPLSSLAIVSISRRFPAALIELSYLTLFVAYPILSSASARGDRQLMNKFLLLSVRNLLAVALPVSAALFVGSEQILRKWIGPEVLAGVPIFRLFLVFAVFASLRYAPLTYLYGAGRIGFVTAVSAIQLVTGIGVGAWACLRWGLFGLALCFAVLQCAATVLIAAYAAKAANLDASIWIRKSVLPPLLATSAAVLAVAAIFRGIPRSVPAIGISTILGVVIFAAILSLILSGRERLGWRRRMKALMYEVN